MMRNVFQCLFASALLANAACGGTSRSVPGESGARGGSGGSGAGAGMDGKLGIGGTGGGSGIAGGLGVSGASSGLGAAGKPSVGGDTTSSNLGGAPGGSGDAGAGFVEGGQPDLGEGGVGHGGSGAGELGGSVENLEPGACTGGTDPVLFASPTDITSNEIALTDDYVYWNDRTAIMRAPKAGGSPEHVIAVGANAYGVHVDSRRVYWVETDTLRRIIHTASIADPSDAQVLASDAGAADLVVGTDVVYYVSDPDPTVNLNDPHPTKVVGLPSQGGPPLVSADQPTDAVASLAVDSAAIYWAYDSWAYLNADELGDPSARSVIRRLSLLTGNVSDFAPATLASELVADGSHVVWADDRYPAPTNIWSSNADGTALHELATAALVRGLASDGTYAYVAASAVGDDYSDIYRVPLVGGPAESLACHVGGINGLRVDDSHVYYFTYYAERTIQRLPKTPTARERTE